jgi:hypothetical protein
VIRDYRGKRRKIVTEFSLMGIAFFAIETTEVSNIAGEARSFIDSISKITEVSFSDQNLWLNSFISTGINSTSQ